MGIPYMFTARGMKTMSNEAPEGQNHLTVLERIERCEDGLEAIETILRCAFPQFFEPPTGANDNGHEEAISGAKKGPGETGEETGEEGSEKTLVTE